MIKTLDKKETLLNECKELGINVVSNPLPQNVKGLYYSDSETEPVITLNPSIDTESELCCVIAEELGHYHTSCGDLLSQDTNKTVIDQQECRARRWAFEKLIPLDKFIEAYTISIKNRYELSQFLDVTEEFLDECINYYTSKYGTYKIIGKYIIYFEPLGIFRMFE
ncbi:MAG: hypothetical protein K0R50_248 [Eubacterium sp.]|jgi:Zn-dependent peptidase ImmA (M78 family)|nr:hypothetical protein [Eubacterium sp.]